MRSERKRILIGLLCAGLLTVLAFVSVSCVSAATTRHVNPGDSIQDVVDAADPGDTIIVRDGTYTENVVVDVANLTLRSENGSASTTVLAAVNTSDVFRVTANSVTITGFTIRNANGSEASGIYLYSVHHCTVSDNNASGNYFGIHLDSSNNNNLTGNNASNNTHGISLDSSNNNNLTSNNASNNYNGISLFFSSNDALMDNIANLNNWSGMYLYASSNNTLTGNAVNSTKQYGIYLYSACNNILTGNSASNNNYGIYLYSASNNNNLTANTVSNNNYGIYLRSSSNNLTGNTAVNNT